MSKNNSSESYGGGVGLCGAVFLVFLVLKLCGVIHWSWWWVTGPLWMPFAIIAGSVLIALAFWLVAVVFDHITLRWQWKPPTSGDD